MDPTAVSVPCRDPRLLAGVADRLVPVLPGLVARGGTLVLRLDEDSANRALCVLSLPEGLPLPRPVLEIYLRAFRALGLDDVYPAQSLPAALVALARETDQDPTEAARFGDLVFG